MARPLKPSTPFAERLIQARGDMSRDDAAEALGCKTDTLGDYERGRSFPPQEVLERVRAVYDVSLDWLITGQGEMRPKLAADDGVSSTANTTASIDRDLLAAVHKGVAEVYRSENARISADPLADEVARVYDDLVATYDSPEERLSALKLALRQLRRELQAPAAGTSRKQVS